MGLVGGRTKHTAYCISALPQAQLHLHNFVQFIYYYWIWIILFISSTLSVLNRPDQINPIWLLGKFFCFEQAKNDFPVYFLARHDFGSKSPLILAQNSGFWERNFGPKFDPTQPMGIFLRPGPRSPLVPKYSSYFSFFTVMYASKI